MLLLDTTGIWILVGVFPKAFPSLIAYVSLLTPYMIALPYENPHLHHHCKNAWQKQIQ
jgi:hypothetical protein